MGNKVTELLTGQEITLNELKGKTFTVDAHNILYQFLSNIRQRDGSLLTDSKGNVTSHLVGLFNRMSRLMLNQMNFIFCFDGEVPELKYEELSKRKEAKKEAVSKYESAKETGDEALMKKYAQRSTRLTKEMIEDAKKLIKAMGQCYIDAPSEGEAQASYIVKKGDAYAVISQDADCFLFGSPRLIKNLTLSGKRKLPGQHSYVNINPEMLSLENGLKELDISHDQLMILGILIGTDFNVGGIKGIGPKKALKLVKEFDDFDKLFKEAKWNEHFQISWEKVYDVIKNMKVTDDYEIRFENPSKEKVVKLLVEKHDFEPERVKKTMDEFEKASKNKQKGLGDFF